MPKIVVIERDTGARARVKRVLSRQAGTAIVGEAGTIAAARGLLARGNYDLVFLGLKFRGGTGFDLVPHVSASAVIILMKSTDPGSLADALRHAGNPSAPCQDTRRQTSAHDLRVAVKTGSGTTRYLSIASISLVTSSDNYSEITLAHGARHFVRRTLKSWAESLPRESFVRVHRRAIVNLTHLHRADRASNQTKLLTLAGVTKPVRASFRYFAELRRRLTECARA